MTTYCLVCSGIVEVSEIAPNGHSNGEPQFLPAPTCTESGISKTFCTVCNAETDHTDLAPLGHTFSEWEVTFEPTGESEGTEERTCSVCSYKESNALAKLTQSLECEGISATLNSSASFYPYNSSFKAEKITGSVTDEEIAAFIPEGYVIIEVLEFVFTDKNGEIFQPSSDVTYSVEYALDTELYSSFLICDTEMGRYTPFSEDSKFSFTVQKSGRFILVGEEIPETQPPESSENDPETSTNIPVSVDPERKSPISIVLIIVSIILVIAIAGLIYFYVFKQYY
jgi:hypothetical protein